MEHSISRIKLSTPKTQPLSLAAQPYLPRLFPWHFKWQRQSDVGAGLGLRIRPGIFVEFPMREPPGPRKISPVAALPFPTCPSPPQPASVIGSSVIVSRAPNGILSGISVTGLLICSLRRQRSQIKNAESALCVRNPALSPSIILSNITADSRFKPHQAGDFLPKKNKTAPVGGASVPPHAFLTGEWI